MTQENFKFAHHGTSSVSTAKEEEKSTLNRGNQGGMRVAMHNKETIVKGAVNSTRVSQNNSKQQSSQRGISKNSKLSQKEDIAGNIRKYMNAMANKDVAHMNIVGHSKLATNLNSSQQRLEAESYAKDYLNLTNQTHSSPHGSSLGNSATGKMAARMLSDQMLHKGLSPRSKMVILGSREGNESAAIMQTLPAVHTPTEAEDQQRMATSSPRTCSTPSSKEQVQNLIQLTDQLNISPAPFGMSSRGSNEMD